MGSHHRIDPNVTAAYLDLAFDRLLAGADAAGPRLDERPFGADTNAVGAIVFHCCEVAEFWLGHVALGRPSHRRRDEEFSTALPLDELRERVGASRDQARRDVADLAAGRGQPSEIREFLPAGGGDDGSVVLHVIEELFQHAGQIDLTLDALRSREDARG